MTDIEILNQKVQQQLDAQNARIDTVLAKVDMIIGEMRDRDNQRAEDIRRLQDRQDAMQTQHNADIKALNEKRLSQNLISSVIKSKILQSRRLSALAQLLSEVAQLSGRLFPP